jgi:tRNA A37 methylthiotransferase MiaB
LEVKKDRSLQALQLFRDRVLQYHQNLIGKTQLILIEGTSRRSKDQLFGRNDSNTKVIIDRVSLPDVSQRSIGALIKPHAEADEGQTKVEREVRPGDYVLVQITDCTSQTLIAKPKVICTLAQHSYSNQTSHSDRVQMQQ